MYLLWLILEAVWLFWCTEIDDLFENQFVRIVLYYLLNHLLKMTIEDLETPATYTKERFKLITQTISVMIEKLLDFATYLLKWYEIREYSW